MAREAVAQTDRRLVDRAGLDYVGTFGGDLFRGLIARAHDGDVAGPIVVVIVVAREAEKAASGGGLRFVGSGELAPAVGGSLLGKPFVLRIGQKLLAMRRRPQDIDAESLGRSGGEGAAMGMFARRRFRHAG